MLHVYPLDKVTSEGRPFWSLPKRAPHKQEFDPENELHATFVSSYACLYANKFGIEISFDKPRSKESRLKMAKIASGIKVKEFVINDEKAKEIE